MMELKFLAKNIFHVPLQSLTHRSPDILSVGFAHNHIQSIHFLYGVKYELSNKLIANI